VTVGFARTAILAGGLLAYSGAAWAEPPAAQPVPSQVGAGGSYVLLGTEVWDVPDPVSKRGYQVFVSLPASYAKEPQRRYPVLYVTDANYAFPIVREIGRRINNEGPQVEEFILVGLSYAKGEDPKLSRNRDYTPTANGPKSAPAGSDHGHGAAYLIYLRDQVKPFIAGRYRADPKRSLFLGHSYGGLLGAQILFTEPDLFSGYILGSPSLWFDGRHIFGLEAAYAAKHRDLAAKVYLYVGEYESIRHRRRMEMVGDNRSLEAQLKKRAYASLSLKSDVLNDEDHVSVAPRGFTHGLKFLLPARKSTTATMSP
jgi:predicted alpha/beta superfamily hydrolase